MHLESAHRVLVIGGDENHRDVVADELEDVEAGELGHLYIEKNQIGLLFGNGFDGLEAVGAFTEDFHLRMRLQQVAYRVTREVLIVH